MQEKGVSCVGEVNYQKLEYLTCRKQYEHIFKQKSSKHLIHFFLFYPLT